MRQLPTHHLERLSGLPLLERLANTQNRFQTATKRRRKLATDHLVAFTQQRAPLRMADQHPLAARIRQLSRRGFARQRTKPGLFCAILSASRKRQALQTTHNLRDMHTGRKHHHLDLRRQLLLAERLDELCNAGAGTVHLPVTSYHGATHALPRRSKWAQMLLNRSEPGKRESRTNFGN